VLLKEVLKSIRYGLSTTTRLNNTKH